MRGLADRGVFFWDEAVNLQEARFVVSSFALAADLGSPAPDLTAWREKNQGTPPYYAKPMHTALIALSMAVVGVSELAGNLVSALLGLARSLAREMGSRNVTVNAVVPGLIETEMIEPLTEKRRAELLGQTNAKLAFP